MNTSGAILHDEAEELLPWYATGRLDPDEKARFEQHLSGCPECREQLAFERQIIPKLKELEPEIESGWERLKRRLEVHETAEDLLSHPKSANNGSAIWQAVSRPSIAFLAAAQIAFLVLAGSVLVSLGRPSYHALGSMPSSQSANVIIIFRADTRESELRGILERNDASLVGGPTPADAYLLRVPAKSRSSALGRMRADRHVVIAEPIDGATSS